MARQKLPQHKDDCIKCTLPEPNGVYHACMNCRNKAVEENKRLQIIIDDLERRLTQEPSEKASLLADVNGSAFTEKQEKAVYATVKHVIDSVNRYGQDFTKDQVIKMINEDYIP